jgi:hypothetical protein
MRICDILNEMGSMTRRSDNNKKWFYNGPGEGPLGQEVGWIASTEDPTLNALVNLRDKSDPTFYRDGETNKNLIIAPNPYVKDTGQFDDNTEVNDAVSQAESVTGYPIVFLNPDKKDNPDYLSVAFTPAVDEKGNVRLLGKYMLNNLKVLSDKYKAPKPDSKANQSQFDDNELKNLGYTTNDTRASIGFTAFNADDIFSYGGSDKPLQPNQLFKDATTPKTTTEILSELSEYFPNLSNGDTNPLLVMAQKAAAGDHPIDIIAPLLEKYRDLKDTDLRAKLGKIERQYGEVLHPLSLVSGGIKTKFGDLSQALISYTPAGAVGNDGQLLLPTGQTVDVSSKKDTNAVSGKLSDYANTLDKQPELKEKYPDAAEMIDILGHTTSHPTNGNIGPLALAVKLNPSLATAINSFVKVFATQHNKAKIWYADNLPPDIQALVDQDPDLQSLIDNSPVSRHGRKIPYWSVTKMLMDQVAEHYNDPKYDISGLMNALEKAKDRVLVVTTFNVAKKNDVMTIKSNFSASDATSENKKYYLKPSTSYRADGGETTGMLIGFEKPKIEKGPKGPPVSRNKPKQKAAQPNVPATPAVAPDAREAWRQYTSGLGIQGAQITQALPGGISNPANGAFVKSLMSMPLDQAKAELVQKGINLDDPKTVALIKAGGLSESAELDRIKQLIKY